MNDINIILKSKEELTAKEVYLLTMNPETKKMSSEDGNIVQVDTFCVYEEENSKGEAQVLLAIKTPDDVVYATNSGTFREDFLKMNALFASMDEKVNSIKVISGTSKNDRTFYTCVFND